jgi:gas vesicle protein
MIRKTGGIMNKFANFVLGIFTGALVGGILALMFTPLKGSALRARLGNSFVHVQHEVKQAAKDRMFELNQQLARMQNKPVD